MKVKQGRMKVEARQPGSAEHGRNSAQVDVDARYSQVRGTASGACAMLAVPVAKIDQWLDGWMDAKRAE